LIPIRHCMVNINNIVVRTHPRTHTHTHTHTQLMKWCMTSEQVRWESISTCHQFACSTQSMKATTEVAQSTPVTRRLMVAVSRLRTGSPSKNSITASKYWRHAKRTPSSNAGKWHVIVVPFNWFQVLRLARRRRHRRLESRGRKWSIWSAGSSNLSVDWWRGWRVVCNEVGTRETFQTSMLAGARSWWRRRTLTRTTHSLNHSASHRIRGLTATTTC